ncbi:MAG: hypothetical protein H6686_10895 [Fibrobacteria bacterium]|nr:hypothetical protein [Fibrobacteria bacterium]
MSTPFTITSRILTFVAEIAGVTERVAAQAKRMTPKLRRGNRIRTIQASLAIEQNTLTLEQVTALLEGKRVLGAPREIQKSATPLRPTTSWRPGILRRRQICSALRELPKTDHVTVQVTEQVAALLKTLGSRELGTGDLMKALALSHRPTFLANYLDPALKAGFVERTDPASPRSPRQKYRRTELGRRAMGGRGR